MKYMGLNELREKYLSFFESKGHLRHKSFPLVPQGDKSILLINAGMTPLKKYFTGEIEPPRHRMTTCQKCIRTPDIERVGITARHGTFFEMLGNFSFGDYFKEEAISWAWEFITDVLEMPVDRLWVTIYQDDDEAFDIWHNKIGVSSDRIVRLGKEDNFWEHGSGPCGPCSEIHFDRGEEYGCGSPDCKPGCDCDRFMEFWNLVFTQFDNDGKGNYTRLPKPNIDTGMGLERLACLMQGVDNLFEVDTVQNIMKAVAKKAGVNYGDDKKTDISLRVITDHIRSTAFMVCDGVVPSNEGRGYVLRRLLRRAARHGRLLGINDLFLADLVDVVAHENLSEYPELTEKLEYIKKIIRIEEERFSATIDSGLSILSGIINDTISAGGTVLSGEDIFRLYDTFGFPIDLTREIAEEAKLGIDEEGFRRLMAEQRERARSARANISGWSDEQKSFISSLPHTEFVGYENDSSEATVIAVIVGSDSVDEVTEGEFSLILDKTPFYGEGGGQVGDTGLIYDGETVINVTDTKKTGGVYVHLCSMTDGVIKVGDKVSAKIDVLRRNAIRRNHSAAHLLQAALRRVLGSHVEQAGSYVDDTRVRFDFSHFAALTPEELNAVEALVNENILAGEPVTTVETDIETARKSGAMALFGEKYGAVVRMVKMGDFSTELCGGTHLDNTAKAGLFRIISESSVAAGVRRIEGTTGYGVLELLTERDRLISDAAHELKAANSADIARRSAQVMGEIKDMKHEIDVLGEKLADAQTGSLISGAEKIGSIRLVKGLFKDCAPEFPRTVCDKFKSENSDVVAVICADIGGKLTFTASCGKDAVKAGAHAGNIVKAAAAITGGGGGGRPDSASAGAKDASKLEEAMSSLPDIIKNMLKA
ncbi:MAG: alanine--tRNA ligase [Firmicutes bacterium]|nr:alanine--tRNA ligase [Bacillota bacterium]